MRSVDPSTADGWPVDPYAGFLPPNDGNGSGEGYVAYRIRVRDDAPADAVINSSASIVFDYNEPMLTDPSWSNVVHAGAPSSPELARLPEVVNGNAALSWTASDFASSYDVYIWRDGEDMPETAYLSDLTGTSVKLDMDFEDGLKYKFAVVAKNRYGSSASNTVESIAKPSLPMSTGRRKILRPSYRLTGRSRRFRTATASGISKNTLSDCRAGRRPDLTRMAISTPASAATGNPHKVSRQKAYVRCRG